MRFVLIPSVTLAALALAACAGPKAVVAGPGGGGGSPNQSQMWTGPAGLFLVGLEQGQPTLTLAEFQSSEDAIWKSADADGDGTVRSLELQTWRRTWFGSDDGWPGLFHFDQNGDGVLNPKEFKAGLESIFTAFDKNKDGILTRSELLSERPSADTRSFERRGERGERGRERPDQQ